MSREITREGQIGSQRRVPIELESHFLRTSRGPKHFTGPPDSNRILLKSKKFVNKVCEEKCSMYRRAPKSSPAQLRRNRMTGDSLKEIAPEMILAPSGTSNIFL